MIDFHLVKRMLRWKGASLTFDFSSFGKEKNCLPALTAAPMVSSGIPWFLAIDGGTVNLRVESKKPLHTIEKSNLAEIRHQSHIVYTEELQRYSRLYMHLEFGRQELFERGGRYY